MKINRKQTLLVFAGVLVSVALMGSACTSADYDERVEQQDAVTLDDSLGLQAQQERLNREEDTTAVRYVYVMPIGSLEAIGYYVINGGVYDASTQLAPEQEIICKWANDSDSCSAVDSARDNNTYGGEGGDGFFFFTSDGALVELAYLAYIQSDQPIPVYVDVPRLAGNG
jgi:ABC-type antimicrobial peptide transport system permease subunit